MLKDPYYQIDLEEKRGIILSLRFWMMWDLWHRKESENITHETDVMLEELEKRWPKDICVRFFEESWNGLTATFLHQYGIEPLITYH